MDNKINLGISNKGPTLVKMNKVNGQESKTYRVVTNSAIKVEYDPFTLILRNGRTLTTGDYIEEAKATIKSIDYIVGYGYTLTFE